MLKIFYYIIGFFLSMWLIISFSDSTIDDFFKEELNSTVEYFMFFVLVIAITPFSAMVIPTILGLARNAISPKANTDDQEVKEGAIKFINSNK